MNENLSAVQLVFNEIIKSDSLDQVLDNLKNIKKKNIENLAAIAYSWVLDKIKNLSDESKNAKSFRHISNDELDILGQDNYSYIMHFYNLGLLTSEEVDRLMYQVQLMPPELIDKKVVNILLIAYFIYGDIDILPGSRLHLYSSDTIN